MTPDDLFAARYSLGIAWGIGRALTLNEMGRILGLAGDPGEAVRDLERGKGRISGPLTLAFRLMLAGARPDDWRDHLTERTTR